MSYWYWSKHNKLLRNTDVVFSQGHYFNQQQNHQLGHILQFLHNLGPQFINITISNFCFHCLQLLMKYTYHSNNNGSPTGRQRIHLSHCWCSKLRCWPPFTLLCLGVDVTVVMLDLWHQLLHHDTAAAALWDILVTTHTQEVRDDIRNIIVT